MLNEVVETLPPWLLVGGALGALCTLLVAGLFYAGARLFPTATPDHGAGRPGEDRRRAEIRQYLEALGEAYAEDHDVEGQSVAFYLPERDVAITFDARAYYRIDRSGTDAVLVEHELPGFGLGSRLPFETPELEFGTSPTADVDPTTAALAVLGLPRGASPDEVRTAYREKVKEVHPDLGGDEEEFRRLREAYTTAKERVTERRSATQ